MRRFSFLRSKAGQSLIEVLIAITVGVFLVIAAATVIVPSLKINTQAGRVQTGSALAKELMDNIRVWAERDWHNVLGLSTSSVYHYRISTSSSPFSAVLGDELVMVSGLQFRRYFYLDDARRDSNDSIIASGGSYDPSTKKITVIYSWPQGATNSLQFYVTRFRNNALVNTDWSGGPNQEGPTSTVNSRFATSTAVDYTTSTGSIIIKFN
ncbi:MAG: hypothetical protein AAB655_01715 [Patescibacteria group bacterium]